MAPTESIERWMRGVGSSRASAVRILLFTLAFLFVAGEIQFGEEVGWVSDADTPYFKEMVAFGDPRGFRGPLPPKVEGEFRIAWIGSSSLRTSRRAKDGKEDITKQVGEELIRRGHLAAARIDPVILSYVVRGERIYGLYLTLLDALAREPDMIVLTLGPLFVYDTHAVSRHKWWLPSAVSRLPAQPKPWLEYALLSRPSDWAQGLLLTVSPLVRNQADLHQLVSELPSRLALKAPNEVKESKESGRRSNSPLVFWAEARATIEGRRAAPFLDVMFSEGFDASVGSRNDQILDRMIGLVSETDIPALVYVAPVNKTLLEDPEGGPRIRMIETRMAEKRARFERPRLRIVSENPGRKLLGLKFQDYVHLNKTGNWIPTLVETIEALTSESGTVREGGAL